MPAVREERRVVTALFADVVGSTALAERLGPEEVKLVIGEAISRSIGIVESYGGAINNLGGDSLLAIFGAPVAHEDDPERAIRAALEIIAAANNTAIMPTTANYAPTSVTGRSRSSTRWRSLAKPWGYARRTVTSSSSSSRM